MLKKLDQCLRDEILKEGAPTEKDYSDGKDSHLHNFDDRLFEKANYFITKSKMDA